MPGKPVHLTETSRRRVGCLRHPGVLAMAGRDLAARRPALVSPRAAVYLGCMFARRRTLLDAVIAGENRKGMMAVWIAKFLGPVFLTLGLPMVAAPTRLQETTKRFLADRPLILVTGVLVLTAGLSIVNTHNVWVWDWTLIITLTGWALVLSGAARLLAPDLVDDLGGKMTDRPALTRLAGALWALLGAFLTYKGYA